MIDQSLAGFGAVDRVGVVDSIIHVMGKSAHVSDTGNIVSE